MQEFDVDLADVNRAVDACGLFSSLAGDVLDDLLNSFDGLRLNTGEVLMREGEIADSLYVVRHGRLRARVTDARGDDVMVGEIGKSEVVGEMAVITDQYRSATVYAMRDTDLFRLPAEAFGRLIQRHPEMLRPFASVVVNRLRTAMSRPTRPALPATIVLIPAGADDCIELSQQLAAAVHRVHLSGAAGCRRQRPRQPGRLAARHRERDRHLVADRRPGTDRMDQTVPASRRPGAAGRRRSLLPHARRRSTPIPSARSGCGRCHSNS